MDAVKRELMHHSWKKHAKNFGLGPPVLIPKLITVHPELADLDEEIDNDLDDAWTAIHLSKTLKWLGVIFDPKLTFKTHIKAVCAKAKKACSALSILGNSTNGMHQIHLRNIYEGAVIPIMTYASPVWWKGSKQKNIAAALDVVQNKGLRHITGAFRTTPIHALQIMAHMPPMAVRLNYITDRAAIRFFKLDERNPITCRLREDKRAKPNEPVAEAPPIDPPHKKNRNWRDPHKREFDRQKQAMCTNLWRTAEQMTPDTERIDGFAEPPWRRSELDEDLRHRIDINIPPPKGGTSFKKQWAAKHKAEIAAQGEGEDQMRVYSDGSMVFHEGIRRTGLGVVAYHDGTTAFEHAAALGEQVVVYDTEMEGMASAAERTRTYLGELDEAKRNKVKNLHFFCDNTGAIYRCFAGTPGKAQACSRRFRKAVLEIIDTMPEIHVEIAWSPGHLDIVGNERADALAGFGGALQPANPEYQSISYVGCARRRDQDEKWKHLWANTNRGRNSAFNRTNNIPPSTHPSKHFKTLSRRAFSRIVQVRTGHAHLGEYYATHVPTETQSCWCGEPTQTRRHVIVDCELYEQHRHHLGKQATDRALGNLLNTEEGLIRLSAFIEASGAFTKYDPS